MAFAPWEATNQRVNLIVAGRRSQRFLRELSDCSSVTAQLRSVHCARERAIKRAFFLNMPSMLGRAKQ